MAKQDSDTEVAEAKEVKTATDYESTKFGVKFSIADKLTIRQQLAFRSELFLTRDRDRFERFWIGSQHLIEDWECEKIPDRAALDLEVETDPAIADIVNYVGTTVAGHLAKIGAVPKND